MKRVAIISDSHGFVDEDYFQHLREVDLILHAGDIGKYEVIEKITEVNENLVAVYGNIDSGKLRVDFPINQFLTIDGVKVFMTHIGGYPGRYTHRVKNLITKEKPNLYICGHSHILKIVPDRKHDLLHMNPGAVGHHGFHSMRTMILFSCTEGKLKDVQVIELGMRGRL